MFVLHGASPLDSHGPGGINGELKGEFMGKECANNLPIIVGVWGTPGGDLVYNHLAAS